MEEKHLNLNIVLMTCTVADLGFTKNCFVYMCIYLNLNIVLMTCTVADLGFTKNCLPIWGRGGLCTLSQEIRQ